MGRRAKPASLTERSFPIRQRGVQYPCLTLRSRHFNSMGALEARLSAQQFQSPGAIQTLLTTHSKTCRDILLPLTHPSEVNRYRTGNDTVVWATTGEVCDSGARDHRLRRRTANVDARTTNRIPFDYGGLPSSIRQTDGQWLPGLTRR
jgi:hypothetical protein